MDKALRSEIKKPLQKAGTLVKKAEKNTTRLAAYDEKVRDPIIKKYEVKNKMKLPKPPKGMK